MGSSKKHLKISLKGKVQGVFMRDTAKERAQMLGLTGFARNEPDGTVHIEAEGEEAPLHEFVSAIRQGTPFSDIIEIKVEEGEVQGFSDFAVT